MGGLWSTLMLFLQFVFGDKWKKYEPYFNYSKGIFKGLGYVYLVGGLLALLIYIMLALPDLIVSFFKFVIPLIVKILFGLLMDENNPIGAVLKLMFCMFGGCPKKPEEAGEEFCNQNVNADKIMVEICDKEKDKNEGNYPDEMKKKCEKAAEKVKQCEDMTKATDFNSFENIMSGKPLTTKPLLGDTASGDYESIKDAFSEINTELSNW